MKPKNFPAAIKTICVANVNGVVQRYGQRLPASRRPAGQGMIEGGKVVCPWHGWAWDVKTGVADQDSSTKVAYIR